MSQGVRWCLAHPSDPLIPHGLPSTETPDFECCPDRVGGLPGGTFLKASSDAHTGSCPPDAAFAVRRGARAAPRTRRTACRRTPRRTGSSVALRHRCPSPATDRSSRSASSAGSAIGPRPAARDRAVHRRFRSAGAGRSGGASPLFTRIHHRNRKPRRSFVLRAPPGPSRGSSSASRALPGRRRRPGGRTRGEHGELDSSYGAGGRPPPPPSASRLPVPRPPHGSRCPGPPHGSRCPRPASASGFAPPRTGQALSSTASHGSFAAAVGVVPVNAWTSWWRWDWSA